MKISEWTSAALDRARAAVGRRGPARAWEDMTAEERERASGVDAGYLARSVAQARYLEEDYQARVAAAAELTRTRAEIARVRESLPADVRASLERQEAYASVGGDLHLTAQLALQAAHQAQGQQITARWDAEAAQKREEARLITEARAAGARISEEDFARLLAGVEADERESLRASVKYRQVESFRQQGVLTDEQAADMDTQIRAAWVHNMMQEYEAEPRFRGYPALDDPEYTAELRAAAAVRGPQYLPEPQVDAFMAEEDREYGATLPADEDYAVGYAGADRIMTGAQVNEQLSGIETTGLTDPDKAELAYQLTDDYTEDQHQAFMEEGAAAAAQEEAAAELGVSVRDYMSQPDTYIDSPAEAHDLATAEDTIRQEQGITRTQESTWRKITAELQDVAVNDPNGYPASVTEDPNIVWGDLNGGRYMPRPGLPRERDLAKLAEDRVREERAAEAKAAGPIFGEALAEAEAEDYYDGKVPAGSLSDQARAVVDARADAYTAALIADETPVVQAADVSDSWRHEPPPAQEELVPSEHVEGGWTTRADHEALDAAATRAAHLHVHNVVLTRQEEETPAPKAPQSVGTAELAAVDVDDDEDVDTL